MRAPLVWSLLGALACGACVGQTGGDTVVFAVAASGPADAVAGQPLTFSTGGFSVSLARAQLHVGAVYLDQSAPVSGGQATGCYLTGTYVAEETSALDVDLLDPAPQRFPTDARGITDPAPRVGELWLTGGDVNAASDPTVILSVAGSATQGAVTLAFTGTVTIGANRQPATTSAAGGSPICKQRIVTPIPAAPALRASGGLLVRIDPRRYFEAVDFTQLPTDPANGARVFPDGPGVVAAQNFYSNLRSIAPYTFTWSDAL
ncbi:MAG TPA: hypothetical protein VMU50_07885 [Polyangia bacterium]|nr:hypothetical protein [Polyangia bacterium]